MKNQTIDSTDWRNVYNEARPQVQGIRSSNIILATLAGCLAALFVSPFGLPIFLVVFIIVVGLGILFWIKYLDIDEDVIVLEAKLIKKRWNFSGRRNLRYYFEINIQRAFTVNAEGETKRLRDWVGRRNIKVSFPLYQKHNKQDRLALLCLLNGEVLGDLKEYIKS